VSLIHRPSTALAAILLALAGCNNLPGGGGGDQAATAQAAGVTPEALQAAVTDEPLRRFYEARQWQSAWSDQSAEQLKTTLRGAVNHGLDPNSFLQEVERAGSPVEKEVAMSRAALSYAQALAHGKTDPAQLFEVYTLPRNQVDVPAGLAQAASQGQATQWIESQAPQDEEYRALSQAYVQQLQATRQPQPPQQPQHQGQQQDDQATGKGKAKDKARPKEKAREQRTQEMAPEAPSERAVVLAVNLERRRWLPRQAEATRIDVNTAATFLRYIRDNQIVDQRVVVNGEPGWETPQLGSPIYRLVANPDWTVPESIEKDELANLSAAQLARKNMKRENGRLVQQPGPDNALGVVKLDMQNEHAIYLHDTPSKSAFGQERRHLSHGCVRVKDALGFARMLAEHSGKLAEFDKALAQKSEGNPKTAFVDLGQQIPVRLLYHTAYVDNGQLAVVADPYGWDAKVAQALGLPVPPASQANQQSAEQKRQRRLGDFGP